MGLVWGGSLTHANDPRRSIGLGDLAPLFRQPGIDWISLQVGPRAGEAQLLVEAGLVIDPTAALTDFAETANLVTGLDLVIGVDTANLHLASGLGVPSWWLIGEAPDWRYACVGDDPAHNVWYPASRLYRKPVGDAWDATIQQVATDLDAWAG